MNNTEVIETVNKIFKNVFNRENKFSIEEIKEKFAFDVKIPKMVYDSTTNEETWATSIHGNKFITLNNMEKKDQDTGWMLEKRNIDNLEELVSIWNSINLITQQMLVKVIPFIDQKMFMLLMILEKEKILFSVTVLETVIICWHLKDRHYVNTVLEQMILVLVVILTV